MSKSDLFKQAIAEARELKDISMAQAKQQIAEAFAPRIQEMFAAKVNEMDAMDEADEMEEGMEKMEEMSSKEKMAKGLYNEEDEMNETSLDEILAELDNEANMEEGDNLEMEGLEEGDDLPNAPKEYGGIKGGMVGEAKKDDDKDEKKDDKPAAPKAPKADDEAEGDDLDLGADEMGADLDGMGSDLGAPEDQEIVDLSVEEFKNLVRDVVADVLAGGAGDGMGDLDGDAAGLDLGADGDMGAEMGSDMGGAEDEAFSLDEILEQLEMEGLEEDEDKAKAAAVADMDKAGVDSSYIKEEDDLEEAIKTIEELKATINEMNLFNAKLLYTNKVFEAKTLNNTQKAKVLNAFDKANNLNEVKAVYKTLNTTLESGQKTQLKESLGFASKAMGGAPAKPILEENAYVTRFQQLAGIKKLY